MTSVSTSPTLPIPNKPTRIQFGLSSGNANFVRVWVTVAPTGSSLEKKLVDIKDPRNRVVFYASNGGPDFPFDFTFDKGGKYTFVAQEYTKGSGYGGGYAGDPAGSDVEEKVGSETTLTVYVGQRVTQPIGPSQERATLNLWVWDSTIRSTYKSIHGEDTPSITATPGTDRIKSAIESTAVSSALSALVDQSVSSVIGSLSGLVSNYVTNWNAHLANATVHVDADTANPLAVSFSTAYSPNDLKDFINRALQHMRYHFTDDKSLSLTGSGPDSADYHNNSDRPNIPIYLTVNSFSEAYGAFADLHRCYELHRLASGVHPNNDTTNVLTVLPLIMQVHKQFLTVLASANPTPPAAQSSGVQLLISGAGFKEA